MRPFCALIVALALFSSTESTLSAELFRWVDEKGVIHFTDNPHNIPEKHRTSVTTIKARESPRGTESTRIPTDKASVPFVKKGEVVIVQAILNDKAAAKFVVDTGASYTMISQATAKELDIDLQKKLPTIPFQTANGVIHAPLITLDSIEVGGMQLKGLTAAVHDVFPDSGISGLLGLNFLANFRMDIDTKNGFLHLEKK